LTRTALTTTPAAATRSTAINHRVPQAALAGLLSVACVIAGFVVVHSLVATLLLAAAACCVSIFILARAKPALPMTVALFCLAFIPVYWVPVKYYIFPQPGVALLFLIVLGLAGHALLSSNRPTLSSVDVCIGLFFFISLIPVVLGIREWYEFTTNALQWLAPYLAARYLVGSRISYTTFAKVFCAVALMTLPFVYVEAATGDNPFHKLVVNASLGTVWAHEIYRNGQPRPSAALGHPIALSMFLVTAAILALALALRPDNRRRRGWWLAAFGLLFVGQALTISRTGFVMFLVALIFGVFFLLWGPVSRRTRLRVVGLSGAGLTALAILVAASASVRKLVLPFLESDHEAKTSARARENILAASNQYFSWFGHHLETLKEVGITSVDNTYVLLTERWGVIAAALVALMSVPMVVYLLRQRRIYFGHQRHDAFMGGALVLVALANLVGLCFVAPITQEQNIVFLLLGGASAVLTRARRHGVSPATDSLPTGTSPQPNRKKSPCGSVSGSISGYLYVVGASGLSTGSGPCAHRYNIVGDSP
jgi:hypothetical protein